MDKPKLYTIKQGRKNPKRSTLVALDTKHQEALDRAVLAASTNTQAMRATNYRLSVTTWSVEPLQAELAEQGFAEDTAEAELLGLLLKNPSYKIQMGRAPRESVDLDPIGAQVHGDTDPDGDHC